MTATNALTLPQGTTPQLVLETLNQRLPVAIVNHSIRTFLLARAAASHPLVGLSGSWDDEVLFYACALHDIGAACQHNHEQRFEVDGADAAAALLTEAGIAQERVQRVWEAIVLHTSPGIAERFGAITRLTRWGVTVDFGRTDIVDRGLQAEIEEHYPRLQIEAVLTEAVVSQARAKPHKAPRASWPGILLEEHQRYPERPFTEFEWARPRQVASAAGEAGSVDTAPPESATPAVE